VLPLASKCKKQISGGPPANSAYFPLSPRQRRLRSATGATQVAGKSSPGDYAVEPGDEACYCGHFASRSRNKTSRDRGARAASASIPVVAWLPFCRTSGTLCAALSDIFDTRRLRARPNRGNPYGLHRSSDDPCPCRDAPLARAGSTLWRP
jgi:hypothetical protein